MTNKTIENLTKEQESILAKETIESLYSRSWCALNGIDYVNPDFFKAKRIVYQDLYNSKN